MSRLFVPGPLIVASHNQGKVREIAELLKDFSIETHSAADLGLPEPDETELTFIGNAVLKAKAASLRAKLPALADDSGLVVPALNGDPGIYSARWAERPDGQRDFAYAMEQVEAALNKLTGDGDRLGPNAEQRQAYFVCALALAWPDGHVESFEGRVYGTLVWPPRGDVGFGYDPVFLAKDETQTFGEMNPERKHAMSHRADAFEQLVAACFSGAE
jgi:XTP/dITP diphosphohydrolase